MRSGVYIDVHEQLARRVTKKKHGKMPCLVVRFERPLPQSKRQKSRKTSMRSGVYKDVHEQHTRSLTQKKSTE